MKRPLLKAIVAAIPHDDGLLIRTPHKQTLLRGAAAWQWYERLAPTFDGTHTVDEFLAALPANRHSTFHSLVLALKQAGALRDATMDDQLPDTDMSGKPRSDPVLIAHLEQYTESPRRALAEFHSSHILVSCDISAQVVGALRRLGAVPSQNISYRDAGFVAAHQPQLILSLAQTYEEAETRAQVVTSNTSASYLCAGRCGDTLCIGPWSTHGSDKDRPVCTCNAPDCCESAVEARVALPLSAVEVALLSTALAFGALAIVTNTLASLVRPGERMTCIGRTTMLNTPYTLGKLTCACPVDRTEYLATSALRERG
jgi:hypothetical protein